MVDKPKDGVRRAAEKVGNHIIHHHSIILRDIRQVESIIANDTNAREMAEALRVQVGQYECECASCKHIKSLLARFHGTEGER